MELMDILKATIGLMDKCRVSSGARQGGWKNTLGLLLLCTIFIGLFRLLSERKLMMIENLTG